MQCSPRDSSTHQHFAALFKLRVPLRRRKVEEASVQMVECLSGNQEREVENGFERKLRFLARME
jgi:hypothetical protein